MRRTVFQPLHELSRPEIRASEELLAERFVWPGMDKDFKARARFCLSCQRNKVQRQDKSPSGIFPSPDERFSHVNLDVVDTIMREFVRRWVAIFGAPFMVASDRGAQFEFALLRALLLFLGYMRIRTAVYHPAANDMVERFYRHLKIAIEDPTNWLDNLPLAFLGIRAALKSDLDCSAAELVFGNTLRLPARWSSQSLLVPTRLLAILCTVGGDLYARALSAQPNKAWPTAVMCLLGVAMYARRWNHH
nr:unnamed protein product [Spirometra erinaceieuropaei]